MGADGAANDLPAAFFGGSKGPGGPTSRFVVVVGNHVAGLCVDRREERREIGGVDNPGRVQGDGVRAGMKAEAFDHRGSSLLAICALNYRVSQGRGAAQWARINESLRRTNSER